MVGHADSIGCPASPADHLSKARCPSTSVAYDIAHAYRMRGEDLDRLLSVAVTGAGRDYVPFE
jgi:hypothetical protein